MAAGYLITDDTEASLRSRGLIPSAADEIPLIIQDKTFVPATSQLAAEDPTWDTSRWGARAACGRLMSTCRLRIPVTPPV